MKALNRGKTTNSKKPGWDLLTPGLSRSKRGDTGSPSSFSLSPCCMYHMGRWHAQSINCSTLECLDLEAIYAPWIRHTIKTHQLLTLVDSLISHTVIETASFLLMHKPSKATSNDLGHRFQGAGVFIQSTITTLPRCFLHGRAQPGQYATCTRFVLHLRKMRACIVTCAKNSCSRAATQRR